MKSLLPLVFLCVACGGKRTATTTPAPPVARLVPLAAGSYVLVWNNAWLTDGGADQTNRARVSDVAARVVADVAVLQVVADHGETVELTNVRTEARADHCHGALTELDDFELRLVARRADLAPVTPREVHAQFPDGTAITLRAGVAVGSDAAREVFVDEWRFAVPLATDDVGLAYLPSPTLVDDRDSVGLLRDDAPLRSDGRLVTGRPPVVYVTDAQRRGDQTLVTTATTCVALRVFTDVDGVENGGAAADPGYGTIGRGFGGTTYRVSANEPITWPDGRPAGKTLVGKVFIGAEERDDRTCFPVELGFGSSEEAVPGEGVGALKLCFATDHVEIVGGGGTHNPCGG